MSYYDKVYALVRQIPPGRAATYGQLALMTGSPRAITRWQGMAESVQAAMA